mmetsp:Transcript_8330/g.23655  ORF Transcript_8330/g.23655 Transcript_8330/m.23655 type:complete len:410 (-) Transcript_8330:885-2114(-)
MDDEEEAHHTLQRVRLHCTTHQVQERVHADSEAGLRLKLRGKKQAPCETYNPGGHGRELTHELNKPLDLVAIASQAIHRERVFVLANVQCFLDCSKHLPLMQGAGASACSCNREQIGCVPTGLKFYIAEWIKQVARQLGQELCPANWPNRHALSRWVAFWVVDATQLTKRRWVQSTLGCEAANQSSELRGSAAGGAGAEPARTSPIDRVAQDKSFCTARLVLSCAARHVLESLTEPANLALGAGRELDRQVDEAGVLAGPSRKKSALEPNPFKHLKRFHSEHVCVLGVSSKLAKALLQLVELCQRAVAACRGRNIKLQDALQRVSECSSENGEVRCCVHDLRNLSMLPSFANGLHTEIQHRGVLVFIRKVNDEVPPLWRIEHIDEPFWRPFAPILNHTQHFLRGEFLHG